MSNRAGVTNSCHTNAIAFALFRNHMVIMPSVSQEDDMQFDRYLFAQMLRVAFAVTVTLVGIMWLFQTIRILELVINRGAPLADFMVMSVTVIPLWLTVAMPIGTFIAIIWVFHRSLADRELLVAQASGRSAHQLARAPMALGLLVTSFLVFNSVILLPFSFSIYKQIQFKLRNAIPTVMLQDNVFIDVVDGMTMLIGKKYDDGLAEDVFIHDERDNGAIVTLTARVGQFVEKDGQPAVILQDGQRVELTDAGNAGATLLFDTHTVFITPRERRQATRMPIEMNEDKIRNLLDPATSPSPGYVDQRVAEGHYRIVSPMLALALGLVASAGVLFGQIRQSTWSRRTIVTLAVGVACIAALVSSRSLATQISEFRILIYLSTIVPVAIAYGMIAWQAFRGQQVPAARQPRVAT
ncbi:MAG: LptF/LptG family permease [Candidatus Puniceispirillum sp. TMED245]|nr:MAG: LptF/LptG family permease [Candidatus Puniceispirillum sp. TMED245]